MVGQKNLKVSVENFGPVREGEFELKPLTIFIGPNNSGKSYMAYLIYTLSRLLSGTGEPLFARPFVFQQSLFEGHRTKLADRLRGVADRLRVPNRLKKGLVFQDFPQDLQLIFHDGIEKAFSSLSGVVDDAFRDYFGCEDLKELVQAGDPEKTLVVRLNGWGRNPPFINLRLEPDSEKSIMECTLPDLKSFRYPVSEIERILSSSGGAEVGGRFWDWAVIDPLWSQLLEATGIPQQHTYYLPAARTGILQGWQVFASMALRTVRQRIGLERMEMPAFAGVAGDFLQDLSEVFWHPRRRRISEMQPVLGILENQVLGGEISIDESRLEHPRILYKSGRLQLPLQRVSSMVSELASLDLWVRDLLMPGDLLIIDEPEAHLHPGNQRRIASVLVRLVRAGVRVLAATHSSLIVHQLSNHLLASDADPKTRDKLGFTQDDLLRDEELGVYLFNLQKKDGARIKPVPIEPGFGISEDEFVRVAEEISDQTYRVSVSLAKRSRRRAK